MHSFVLLLARVPNPSLQLTCYGLRPSHAAELKVRRYVLSPFYTRCEGPHC